MRISFFGLAACSLLTGCTQIMQAMNADPVESERIRITRQPIEDRGSLASVAISIATDPTRRLVVFNGYPGKFDGSNRVFVCAEAPPDAAQDILESSKAALEIAAGGELSNDARAELTQSLETLITVLSTRTELVEIYRTATSALCRLHMNGGISDEVAETTFAEITLAAIDGATSVISDRANRSSRPIPIENPQLETESRGGDKDDEDEGGS